MGLKRNDKKMIGVGELMYNQRGCSWLSSLEQRYEMLG